MGRRAQPTVKRSASGPAEDKSNTSGAVSLQSSKPPGGNPTPRRVGEGDGDSSKAGYNDDADIGSDGGGRENLHEAKMDCLPLPSSPDVISPRKPPDRPLRTSSTCTADVAQDAKHPVDDDRPTCDSEEVVSLPTVRSPYNIPFKL